MSWDDDEDEGGGRFLTGGWLIGGMFGGSGPTPMTNAGRYLRSLHTGDTRFQHNDHAISDELLCTLRRIEIRSRWPEFQP